MTTPCTPWSLTSTFEPPPSTLKRHLIFPAFCRLGQFIRLADENSASAGPPMRAGYSRRGGHFLHILTKGCAQFRQAGWVHGIIHPGTDN